MFVFSQLLLGFVLLIFGAELLVRGASRLSLLMGIPPLLVGLTVVAYGTSAPEFAVNLRAIFEDPPQSSLVVGNVVGSNISNILLILGITAVVSPLAVERRVALRTVPFMVAVSAAVYVFGMDGVISRLEGGILFVVSLAYSGLLIRAATRERRANGHRREPSRNARARSVLWNLVLIAAGLVLLVEGADLLVRACIEIARLLHVSELVIGLSIVAVGTSLPELATSMVAALKGRREIAVGNLVGSNIFNILLVLGLCALVAPGGVAVERHAIDFDILVMIGVAVACIPIFASNFEVRRLEGCLLLAYYMVYILYLYLSNPAEVGMPHKEVSVVYWFLPLMLLVLLKLFQRALQLARERNRSAQDEGTDE